MSNSEVGQHPSVLRSVLARVGGNVVVDIETAHRLTLSIGQGPAILLLAGEAETFTSRIVGDAATHRSGRRFGLSEPALGSQGRVRRPIGLPLERAVDEALVTRGSVHLLEKSARVESVLLSLGTDSGPILPPLEARADFPNTYKGSHRWLV